MEQFSLLRDVSILLLFILFICLLLKTLASVLSLFIKISITSRKGEIKYAKMDP